MSDLTYYANNPYWMYQIRYAEQVPNDGNYVRFQQGSQGANHPMHIYANPIAYTYMKHGQENINPYKGGVMQSFDPDVTKELNHEVQRCIHTTLNPIGCQIRAARIALNRGDSRPKYYRYT